MDYAPMTYEEFVQQWSLETIPACNEGMALLQAFAEKYPSLFQMASQRGFADVSHPAIAKNQLWMAFALHCSVCEKCNEV